MITHLRKLKPRWDEYNEVRLGVIEATREARKQIVFKTAAKKAKQEAAIDAKHLKKAAKKSRRGKGTQSIDPLAKYLASLSPEQLNLFLSKASSQITQ